MAMLPRLEAQRRIDDITAMSAGLGGMRPLDRQRYIGQLGRQARGMPGAVKATPAGLAAMGVTVIVLPAEGGSDG